MLNNILQRGYWISGWVVCLVAIGGFYLSIRSSNEMSKTLERVATGVGVSTIPLIKYRAYQWIYPTGTNPVNCDNPPTGILARYGNLSNVPVQIHDSTVKIFYGEKELAGHVSTIGVRKSMIIAPGEVKQTGDINNEELQKYLRGKKDAFEPPFIKIKLDIIFSRLNDSQCSHYHALYEIGFSCRQPSLYRENVVEETNRLVEKCE